MGEPMAVDGPGGRLSLPAAVRERVPAEYLAVLEGIASGEPDVRLAERAGVDVAAVPSLVRLAAAKLIAAHGGPPGER